MLVTIVYNQIIYYTLHMSSGVRANVRRTNREAEMLERAAAAEQIAIEGSRLARLAINNDFPLLAYLIDMAVLEAWREATEGEGTPGGLASEAPGRDGV